MVRLREIPRTSAFAWSPGNASPLIATGTVAGALDADFSNSTQLEIWDLDLLNHQNGGELHPKASVSTDSRYGSSCGGNGNVVMVLICCCLGFMILRGDIPPQSGQKGSLRGV